ncbi:MAG: DNA polymerase IV [Chloroflexota bacterium]
MRTIMHVDLDAFYSSIEQRDHPELRGKPVIVGGDPSQRGVVATASYEARRFGIHSAMPCGTAQRLCPQAVFVRPRFDVYHAVSQQLHELFRQLTPDIQPVALDEAFLDLSHVHDAPEHAEASARTLKQRIQDITSLTGSIGIACNKLVAKVASEHRKPDGLTVVPSGGEREFLAPLSVRQLVGVGPRSEERLKHHGITRVAELAGADPGWVVAHLGQIGLSWQLLAQGIDDRRVDAAGELKQVSRETTFPTDISTLPALDEILETLITELLPALRESPPARTVTLKVRYADWTTVTRRRTPGTILTEVILARESRQLLEQSWSGRPLRLMGLSLSNFVSEPQGQLALFEMSSL